MKSKGCSSFVKCGKVFNPDLPSQLNKSEPPILLAEVHVNTKNIARPCVLVKYSEFISFSLLGLSPRINIIYRLIKDQRRSMHAQILQEWEFEFESADVLEIANLDTNQPTVLNFCDCLGVDREIATYKLEIVQIETNNVRSYDITNKSITATVISEAPEELKGSKKSPAFTKEEL